MRKINKRAIMNAHALKQVLRPIYRPRTNLAVGDDEILHDIPIIIEYNPPQRIEYVQEEYVKDINNLYKQNVDRDIVKPEHQHWLGNPV